MGRPRRKATEPTMPTRARSMIVAMVGAAAVTAQFVAGKATRDALFLTSLDFTALPAMLMATSVCSILLLAAHGRVARAITPAILLPAALIASGALFLGEWLMRSAAPSATAVIVYLHVSVSGALLASGFWLIVSERFDPRTAKRRFGQIAGAGTLGGLLGALFAERVASTSGVPAMLLFLAAFQFLTAWLVRLVALPAPRAAPGASIEAAASIPAPIRCGLRVVAQAPHLHHLAALVLLGTTSAALLEYLFKAKVVEAFGPGDNLLRFFALYYAGSNLITFILQTASSRAMLERFGLALTLSTPAIAALAGSIGGLVAPGFGSLLIARGGESIFRGSWFRAGYELFYTPIPAAEKLAAKSVIDVGFDRLGDAVGGGLVRLAVLFAPAAQTSAILWLTVVSSVGAIVAASRLNHWYVQTLEKSLVKRAGGIDLSDGDDDSMRRLMVGMRKGNASRRLRLVDTDASTRLPEAGTQTPGLPAVALAEAGPIRSIRRDPELSDICVLRSGDTKRAIDVLSREDGLTAALIPHAIPLLAVNPLADYALFALRKVAEEHVGELADALLNPNQDYAVRRRLARVFSVCVSQRAADVLLLALDDQRFDVRFQAARSLAAIRDRNPRVGIVRERIYEVVLREVTVGRPVWESRRLLDGFVGASPLDAFVRDRAGQSLAHVFTLLSLVLPREPLQIAFRSLHSADRHLRGTALEYLNGVLPPAIRQPLWPFLAHPRARRPARQRDEVMADLLRSDPSVLRNIAEGEATGGLRGRAGVDAPGARHPAEESHHAANRRSPSPRL
jgi:ATP:ADP antiporter, AAA family